MEYYKDEKIVPYTEELWHKKSVAMTLMSIEHRCFPVELQEDEEDKKSLLDRAVSAFLVMDNHGSIRAECYALDKNDEDVDEEDGRYLNHIFNLCNINHGVYGYSIAVMPEYQGKGYAEWLLMRTLLDCKEKGYKVLYTNARAGGSSHLQEFFGAELVETRHNWFGSGEDFSLYKHDLTALHLIPFTPFIQSYDYDCGSACVQAMLHYYGINPTYRPLMEKLGTNRIDGTLPDKIVSVIEAYGRYPSKITNAEGLNAAAIVNRPVMIGTLYPGVYEGHWLIVVGSSDNFWYVQDVSTGRFGRMGLEELERTWWNNKYGRVGISC